MFVAIEGQKYKQENAEKRKLFHAHTIAGHMTLMGHCEGCRNHLALINWTKSNMG